ncbi:MAG: nucleotidyl transferase AbiEii/AbiGii toxin family protein [Verrucomicrobiaceae bacterium]|nr:nucleotidyl transferase AbiEii/AbiGii toxin family protein [Verrucomicrobiaceae bacterium]
MPLTNFQRQILSLIAANRSEASHFAGGLVLNCTDDSPRYSHDFDIFHEASEEVARASEADVRTLRAAGFDIQPKTGDWTNPSSFRKAQLLHEGQKLEIDWAADSAFRFFPIENDPVLGWRLHLFDMATNKALALAARSVTRDYVDIVELDKTYPLEATIWAACGKDEGYSPMLLLDMMRRFARINPQQLETIQARNLDPIALKKAWIAMSDRAEAEITRVADTLPDTPIGVAFVDGAGKPGWLGTDPTLRIHRPSIRGCWPSVTNVDK